jgi:hypothetical protein
MQLHRKGSRSIVTDLGEQLAELEGGHNCQSQHKPRSREYFQASIRPAPLGRKEAYMFGLVLLTQDSSTIEQSQDHYGWGTWKGGSLVRQSW